MTDTPHNDQSKPMSAAQKKRAARFWLLFPMGLLLSFMIFQLMMIARMQDSNVSQVEPDAYTRSASFDEERAERSTFTKQGWQLSMEASTDHARAIRCALSGPSVVDLTQVAVHCYHPANQTADRRAQWLSPNEPLVIELPVRGRWRVEVVGITADGIAIRHARFFEF